MIAVIFEVWASEGRKDEYLEIAASLRADLNNENDTVRNYRERVRECEALGEYGIAEDIREILRQEQEHQIDLATALREDVPDLSAKRA